MPADEAQTKKTVTIVTPDEQDGGDKVSKKDDKKGDKKEEEISEEDAALKEGLELAVTRLSESDVSLHQQALEHLISEIRSSTSSMTSVPKPLKFLRPHYSTLKDVYEGWPVQHDMKEKMADVLSVLAMTMAEGGSRECLKFKLQGTKVEVASWGHEYVRSLSGEIALEYNERALAAETSTPETQDLDELIDDIIPFQMQHNAEAEAVDLLLEVQQLKRLLLTSSKVDDKNFGRVTLYLMRTADYIADPEDIAEIHATTYEIFKAQGKLIDAMRIALKIDDMERCAELFSDEVGASDLLKKQMCFLLGRHRSSFETGDEELDEICGNTRLAEIFKSVARKMAVMEPKTPEDIYKSHLIEGGMSLNVRRGANSNAPVDSARANLASSFVNAFVNAGTGVDKLMTVEDSSWVHKQKSNGMISAAASIGMLMLWDVDDGLSAIDKYLVSTDNFIKAGACLGVGILCSGVRNESDPALALLSENLSETNPEIKRASICGLGIAHAGQRREELDELLEGPLGEGSIAESSLASLALGIVNVSTCNDEAGTNIATRLMEATDTDLDDSMSRFLCLGLGLLYLGRSERCEPMLEILKTVEHRRGKFASIVLEACAYAGTGNVLKIQQMLRLCAEHLTDPVEAMHQTAAVLGIALIALGEETGTEMCLRTFDHLLHYGEVPVRRIVPLAYALLYSSNPDYTVVDQLSRLSHDPDSEVAMNAIFAIGIVCAGSNNSRVAGILRGLSEFYAKDANVLFIVRIAQGLNSLGKGLVTLNPFHSDRFLMSGPAAAGLLITLFCGFNMKTSILDNYHYLLYFIVPAINPRFVATVNPSLKNVEINMRVGQAVETVGQAGRPRTISGFQTHETPVLLGYKDRAEMAGTGYLTPSSILEGVLIVEENPDEEAVGEKEED